MMKPEMKRKYYYILWALLLALSVYLCIDKKSKLETLDYSNIDSAAVYVLENWGGDAINVDTPWRFNPLISFDELKKYSDLIVRVKAISSRGKNNCTITETEILDVYQGEKNMLNNIVYVYEWGELYFQHTYFARDGYTLMTPQQEYVLFLNKFYNPYSEEEAWLLANVFHGKIITNWPEGWSVIDDLKSGTLIYSEVSDWGLITTDEMVFNCYKDIYENVLSLTGTEYE